MSDPRTSGLRPYMTYAFGVRCSQCRALLTLSPDSHITPAGAIHIVVDPHQCAETDTP